MVSNISECVWASFRMVSGSEVKLIFLVSLINVLSSLLLSSSRFATLTAKLSCRLDRNAKTHKKIVLVLKTHHQQIASCSGWRCSGGALIVLIVIADQIRSGKIKKYTRTSFETQVLLVCGLARSLA